MILYIDPADQAAPAAPSAAKENIRDNSITLDTIENAEYRKDNGEWQESPVFTGLNPNQAYTFYARLKEDYNHNVSPSSAGKTITTRKTMLDNATVTVNGTYTYTGAAIVPEAGNVTVELNGTTIDSDQYTISAANNTNAGGSTVTVTAAENGNYSGSVSTTFSIGKAALTIRANDQSIICGGNIIQGTGQVTPSGLCGGDTLNGITLTAGTTDVPGGDIMPSAAQIQNGSDMDVTANYNITYETGTLTVSYMKPPTLILYNAGEKKEWYSGEVVITAVGYTVSDTSGGDYKDSYIISAHEGEVKKTLYFKDAAGYMSGGVEVTVKFDLTPPTGEIAAGAKWWQNFLHFIGFGNYAAKEYIVTIKAEDAGGSGTDRIEYVIVTGTEQYADADTLAAAGLSWMEYNSGNKPAVPVSNSQYVVYARLTDKVGNVTYISTDGILLDSTPPAAADLSVPEDTLKDVTAGFTFTVSEAADYYYVVLSQNSAAPSAEDIIMTCGGTLPEGTGTAISGTFPKGSGAVSADNPGVSVDVKNLSPNTAYTIYVTAVDRALDITYSAEGTPAGNIAAVQKVDFTTKKTLPVITKAPAVTGTYGQKTGEMTVAGGTAKDGNTVIAGTWAVGDTDKDKIPSAGTAEVTVVFTPESDSYDSVSVQAPLEVKPRNLGAAGVTVSDAAGDYTYTGSEIKPPVAVNAGTPASGISISDSRAALTANDFTVSYNNNTDAGVNTASVTITGQGNYIGSVIKYFTIEKAPGREAPPAFTLSVEANGETDYTVTIPAAEGCEYSFDGEHWSDVNVKTGVNAGETVTGYKRYKETNDYNAGNAVSDAKTMERFTVKTPVISPAGGSYEGNVRVTITCGSPDAEIYYTTDGSTPARSSARYTGAFTVTVPATVKAFAIKDGLYDSVVTTASYTKKGGGGSSGNGGGNGNSGGNENNGGSGGNDEGQGSGGAGSTNPGNGNTTPQIPVLPPAENTGPGNGANPGTGTTPVNPGNGNTARPGTAPGSGILWSVDGKSITADKAGDIDFSVKSGVKTVPVDIINNVTGENYSIQISLAYEGEFGFTAVLSIGLGKENAGYTASLYYYNETTGELEFICADKVAQDGTVSLAFPHASDYVIAIDGDGEEGDGAAESAQPENAGQATGNGKAQDNDAISGTPDTGQTGGGWWVIATILPIAAIGAGVFVAVKKKGEEENGRQ